VTGPKTPPPRADAPEELDAEEEKPTVIPPFDPATLAQETDSEEDRPTVIPEFDPEDFDKASKLLSQRDKLNAAIQQVLDQNTAAWGVKVTNVEIKDIDLDETMIRAMARQAEAERSRRAKVIHAEGEKQAAQSLAEAAQLLSNQPASLQLRYLQTLADISNEKSSTIVFPLPLDLITPLMKNRG